MAKHKKYKKIKRINVLNIIAVILCALTLISFFLPTIKDTSKGGYKFSSMEICFNTANSAQAKRNEELKLGNLDAAGKYFSLYSLESSDETKSSINTSAWLHFGASLASLLAIVFIAFHLTGKNFKSFIIFLIIVSLGLIIGSLISTISFMNVEILNVPIKEIYKWSAGIILGVISSTLATTTLFIKIKNKKAL